MASVGDESSAITVAAELQSLAKLVQSPVKLGHSPAKPVQSSPQSENFLELATPLRGRKRKVSVGSTGCVGIEERVTTRDAEHLRRRLAEVRRKLGCPGHVDHPQVDESSNEVSFDKLEAYKEAVESTTVLQVQDHFEGIGREDSFENYGSFPMRGGDDENENQTELVISDWSFNERFEWQDASTGVRMGNAACPGNDEDEHDMIPKISAEAEEECYANACNDAVDDSTVLGYTFEYLDAVTGTVMGYLLCDDGDDELLALRMMREEEVEVAEKVEKSDREDDVDSTTTTPSDRQFSATDKSSSHCDYEASAMDEQREYMEVQESYEWEDQASGTVFAYATCDEETEEEVIQLGVISLDAVDSSIILNHDGVPLQITMDWKDQSTGVMMGYAFCDVCSEVEATMEELTCTESRNEAAVVAAVQHSADSNPKRRLRSRPFAATLSKVVLIAQSAKRRRLQSARRRQRHSMRLAKNYWDVLSNRHEADDE